MASFYGEGPSRRAGIKKNEAICTSGRGRPELFGSANAPNLRQVWLGIIFRGGLFTCGFGVVTNAAKAKLRVIPEEILLR
jgi:hypothetical protein